MTDIPGIPEPLQPYIPLAQAILMALLIFIVGWIASKWTNSLVKKGLMGAKVDEALARFLGNIAQYTVLAMAVISALGAVGIETTSLVAIFASAGLAVGLALQGSLSNFASGVMILFFKPIRLDDVVTVAGTTGMVKDIGLFATTLETPTNDTVIVPNSAVTGGTIINLSMKGVHRAQIMVGVDYGSDMAQVLEVLNSAVRKADFIVQDPAPAVAFASFGASSLDMAVMFFCKPEDTAGASHSVCVHVYDDLNAAGIGIPFNQIVVHQAEAEG